MPENLRGRVFAQPQDFERSEQLEPPPDMPEAAREFYMAVLQSKPDRLWGPTDRFVAMDIASVYVEYLEEQTKLHEEGQIIKAPPSGRFVRNPRAIVVQQLRREILSMLKFLRIDGLFNEKASRVAARETGATGIPTTGGSDPYDALLAGGEGPEDYDGPDGGH
ncbi:hypothetical protein [Pseudooceanicola sp. LIPI14-2-Ac024]|uniref:hypothetical protein n=1 Tax=Pseudooceanicola sp. LIPI14-2-Ac024 TaxID=3344875 RepID=UPI0035CFE86B